MNWIDIIVLIPLCWYGYRGFRNGFLMEIVSLAALFLGLFISYKFSDLISLWITGTTLAKPISFSLCFILTIVLVNLLGRILKRALKPVLSEFLDKGLGILFGALKVILVFGVLFYFIDTIDKKEILVKHEVKEASIAYKHLSPVMSHILEWKETRDMEEKDKEKPAAATTDIQFASPNLISYLNFR